MAYADKLSLIRHYPYVKDSAYAEFESLVTKKLIFGISETEQSRLDELERSELRFHTFDELTEDVRMRISRCLDEKNEFRFCYEPNGTEREITTAQDLIDRFKIPKERILKIEMPGPSGNVWSDYVDEYRAKLNSILVKAARDGSPAREIVLIGRRSDSYSFLNYNGHQSTRAIMARETLEKNSVITLETNGRLYPGLSYLGVLATIEKDANMRKLKRIAMSGDIFVNDRMACSDYHPRLAVGDRLRYKNRTVEIGISDDGYPIVTKVLLG